MDQMITTPPGSARLRAARAAGASIGGPVRVVDRGTSGTEALVICPERGVIGSGSAPACPRYGAGDLVEADPAELIGSVLVAGRQAVADAAEPVAAIGLTDQGETVLAWDPATGRPLTDAVVRQDRRAEGLWDGLAEHGDELKRLTGLPLGPYLAAPSVKASPRRSSPWPTPPRPTGMRS